MLFYALLYVIVHYNQLLFSFFEIMICFLYCFSLNLYLVVQNRYMLILFIVLGGKWNYTTHVQIFPKIVLFEYSIMLGFHIFQILQITKIWKIGILNPLLDVILQIFILYHYVNKHFVHLFTVILHFLYLRFELSYFILKIINVILV